MATIEAPAHLARRKAEAWITIRLRVRGAATAAFVWDRVFGPVQRGPRGRPGRRLPGRRDGPDVATGSRGVLRAGGPGRGRSRQPDRRPEHRWLRADLGLDEVDSAVAEAIEQGGLVLVQFPRQAHWRGEPIPLTWSRLDRLWEFLWELARHSKLGQPTGRDVFENANAMAYVSQTQSRLVNSPGFPTSLAVMIDEAGRRQVRFKLGPGEIRVFERIVGDDLREWVG